MGELFEMAVRMGVSIAWEAFMPQGWMGAYCSLTHTVTMLVGLAEVTGRSVFAHELGHAHYRHEGTDRPNEWHADKWAAHRLIDKKDYLLATRDQPTLELLADRLDVTPKLASVYVRSIRGPGNFMEFQPVKLQLHMPTYKEVCALAA